MRPENSFRNRTTFWPGGEAAVTSAGDSGVNDRLFPKKCAVLGAVFHVTENRPIRTPCGIDTLACCWRLPLNCSILYYMGTITLRVPDDMDRALQRQSTALGISKSDLAREALKRYLRVTEFRSMRARLVARAQASGINTDEDVFEVLKKK